MFYIVFYILMCKITTRRLWCERHCAVDVFLGSSTHEARGRRSVGGIAEVGGEGIRWASFQREMARCACGGARTLWSYFSERECVCASKVVNFGASPH